MSARGLRNLRKKLKIINVPDPDPEPVPGLLGCRSARLTPPALTVKRVAGRRVALVSALGRLFGNGNGFGNEHKKKRFLAQAPRPDLTLLRVRRVAAILLAVVLAVACEPAMDGAGETVLPTEVVPAEGVLRDRGRPAPTFTRDVAPLVFEHCAPCHRPGEAGPFPLLTYEQVVAHDLQIVDVTGSGYMPPWLPEPGHGDFADERRLSPQQVETLAAWVDGGAPEGDPEDLPRRPDFPKGWQLGEPDLVLTMPEEYTLRGDGKDVFRWFVWPIPLEESRYVRGFEFRPGNAKIVHHARILFDTTGRSLRRDEEDPGPGFSGNMRLGEMKDPSGHWLGWTPGKQPVLRPSEFAWKLERGSDIVLDTHLVPSGKPERLRSTLGLYFSDEPPTRTPVIVRLGAKTMDIPAGEKHYTITDAYTLPVGVEVLNVYPHAHYLATSLKGWAELPDGRTEWLIYIKEWDFNWQDEYRYLEPVRLPAGTVIRLNYTYDNSAENPRNPSQPPKRVTYGWKTEDEMGDMWLQVATRVPEDRSVLQADFELKEMRLHIASFLKALPENPDDYDTHHTLATCYAKTGESELAIRHFREAIRIKPDFGIAHHNLGVALQSQGDAQAALGHMLQAIELGVDVVRTRYYLGEAYRTLGDLPAATREYRRALAVDPQNAETHNVLGIVLRRQGQAAAAMDHYRRAMAADPNYAPAYYNLGNALRTSGERSAALAAYRKAVEIQPDYVDARNNLALVLRMMERHDEALEHLREVSRMAPEESGTWLNLGAALAQIGKIDEAITSLRKAVALAPDTPRVHNSLGLALRAAGKLEEAAAELREAARLSERGTHHE